MRILAIESSSLVASVAVITDDIMTAEYTVNYKKTHSQTLLPMIDEITSMIDLDINTIDAIAISGGPGSFTGLRIGSATAKGLGFALDKPLIHIPTLEGMAFNLYGTQKMICPIMDAKRNQVYTGIYSCKNGELEIIKPQYAESIDHLVSELNEMSKEVVFIGDGIPVYSDYFKENMKVNYTFAPAHLNRQRAGAVGALASLYYKKGIIQKAEEHIPDYLRVSQAERELQSKLKAER